METIPLVEQIDALLPQTQCRQCGYLGCRPYAEAIVLGEASINQCPPGGEEGIQALATLLNLPPLLLDSSRGPHLPESFAVIDEALCIGCTLCLQACPVDAILGASKLMHTVILSECTGCRLCLPPCPVDCIKMNTAAIVSNTVNVLAQRLQAHHFRQRHHARIMRKEREDFERFESVRSKKVGVINAIKPEQETSLEE